MAAISKIVRAGTIKNLNVSDHADGTVMIWDWDPIAGTSGPRPLESHLCPAVKWENKHMVVVEFGDKTGRGGERKIAPWPVNPIALSDKAKGYGASTQVAIYESANYSPNDVRVVSSPMPNFATGWIGLMGGLDGLVAMYPPA